MVVLLLLPCDNKIILKGKTIVSTTDNIKNPTIVGYGMNPDEYNNVIMVEGTDVQFQDQNGKPCVIINKPDGSFEECGGLYSNSNRFWRIVWEYILP